MSKRVAQAVAEMAREGREKERAAGVERWHYVSFANEEAFLGAAMIRGYGEHDVFMKTWELGVNPGNCGVMIVGLVEGAPVPEGFENRLLTKDEAMALNQLVPERGKRGN
jgi:hypothetical protein